MTTRKHKRVATGSSFTLPMLGTAVPTPTTNAITRSIIQARYAALEQILHVLASLFADGRFPTHLVAKSYYNPLIVPSQRTSYNYGK